jgi:glycosyltransferase involved in cell wall biosynthesis
MVGLTRVVRRWPKKDSARVVALLTTYNEERFITGCLKHLIDQGVEVYLIVNCSTDRTVEIAERYLGRGLIGIETFPRAEGVYKWRSILERKEQLATTLEADWFIHADADEVRLPPRSACTLAQTFADVGARGYNAVNFLEFTFVPTREAPDHDHPHFWQTML